MSDPVLTAMVSTYASERYLAGCLDSLLEQTIADRIEIVVVDACSPEREGEIVRAYQQRHPGIRYVRAAERENTSRSFDRATAMARGRYLTTANADDRHHPDFARVLTTALDQHADVGIVYADSLVTHGDNETFAVNSANKLYAWPDYTPTTALSCCLFGAQPVWRRAAHELVGGWNPDYRYANDQDMFLRIAFACGALHVRESLGLFLMRSDSVSGSGSREPTLQQVLAIMRHYRTTTPLEVVFPRLAETAAADLPMATAAALFELGNLCALGPYTDAALALQCYDRAARLAVPSELLPSVRAGFANNSGALLACAGLEEQAERTLALAGTQPAARHNVERLRQGSAAAAPPRPGEMRFVSFDHPVVQASRTAVGIELGHQGEPVIGEPAVRCPWDVFDGPAGVLRPIA